MGPGCKNDQGAILDGERRSFRHDGLSQTKVDATM